MTTRRSNVSIYEELLQEFEDRKQEEEDPDAWKDDSVFPFWRRQRGY
jgi:hypothetical protein